MIVEKELKSRTDKDFSLIKNKKNDIIDSCTTTILVNNLIAAVLFIIVAILINSVVYYSIIGFCRLIVFLGGF